jgi:hypothetical protein
MEPVKIIFRFLKEIERLFGKGKNGLLSCDGRKDGVECHGSPGSPANGPRGTGVRTISVGLVE